MSETVFYTGKGDRGDTGRLRGRDRISKADVLIDTIGTFDEASCAIGVARAQVQSPHLQSVLPEVQRRLIRLMSHLSASAEARADFPGLAETDVEWLEAQIARLEDGLPELTGFVLPGDSPSGAACQLARAIIRRAERRLVALSERESDIHAPNLAFVNRLSSFLFVAALQEEIVTGELTSAQSQE